MRSFRVPFVAMLVSALAGAEAFAQVTPRPTIVIERVETPPKLEDYASGDGVGRRAELGVGDPASEEARRGAGAPAAQLGTPITGFLQRDPNDLAPSTEETVAYLSYDRENLYAVFVCRARDPSRIRARMARRESALQDDNVAVLLDTFNDKQRAYMFFSTPLGIQADGIATEGLRHASGSTRRSLPATRSPSISRSIPTSGRSNRTSRR